VTTQPVQKGEELFLRYGADYWTDPDLPIHLQEAARTHYGREDPRTGIG
jgi:hypothetical protein